MTAVAPTRRSSLAGPLHARLGGFKPTQISGVSLWLRAEALTGLADGAVIPVWNDSSGNSNHATGPASDGQKPIFKAGLLNSRPVARFNPAGRFMAMPTLTSQTVFFVVKHDDTSVFSADYRRLFDASPGINAHSLFGIQGQNYYNPAPSGWPSNFTGTNCWSNGANTKTAVLGGAWSVVSAVSDTPKTGPHWISTYSVGNGAQSLLGDLAEVIFYNRALTTRERRTVERYLGNRHRVAVA